MTTRPILVVDDDPAILDLIAQVLIEEGYDVLTSGSGRTAVELAREQFPKLILLDLMILVGLEMMFLDLEMILLDLMILMMLLDLKMMLLDLKIMLLDLKMMLLDLKMMLLMLLCL